MSQLVSDAFFQHQHQGKSAVSTMFEHSCSLDIDSQPSTCRNTSIVCTIGELHIQGVHKVSLQLKKIITK